MYYRGAAAALIVFDTTQADTLEGAKSWVKELQKKGDPNMVLCLVGNKADLVAKRKVSGEVAREYAASVGALYVEASAKTGEGTLDCFQQVARAVLPKLKSPAAAMVEAKKGVVNLQPQKTLAPVKTGACC
jgi:Ras-related protein Rab-5C